MIKRVSIEKRQKLRQRKEDRNKLDKLIKVLLKKKVISPEDLK